MNLKSYLTKQYYILSKNITHKTAKKTRITKELLNCETPHDFEITLDKYKEEIEHKLYNEPLSNIDQDILEYITSIETLYYKIPEPIYK